ncbi:MAG TPA: carbohydrate porin, partial [Thermoanaerobaculia bacterium]|nr:carbohydrate porin [Thermoanaerobaculia bacterium]
PDITGTRRPQRRKIGWGINAEQGLGKEWSVAVRVGWDDGKTESFAYTEIDRTASLSTSCSGSAWGRPEDRVVVAVVVSGLSSHHRRYLEAGGVGFQVGDGRLRYGEETIVEADYAAAVNTRTAISLDLQRVGNPGFNRDRGPITVYGLRVHFHR